jgi:hypothetical protein
MIVTPRAFADNADASDLTVGDSTPKTLADLEFTTDQIAMAEMAQISAYTNSLYYTVSGSDPAVSVGHLILANQFIVIRGNYNLRKLKLLSATGTADVYITLYED